MIAAEFLSNLRISILFIRFRHFDAVYCYCKNIQIDVEFICSILLTFNHLITYCKICVSTKYLKEIFHCLKEFHIRKKKLFDLWQALKAKQIFIRMYCVEVNSKHILFWGKVNKVNTNEGIDFLSLPLFAVLLCCVVWFIILFLRINPNEKREVFTFIAPKNGWEIPFADTFQMANKNTSNTFNISSNNIVPRIILFSFISIPFLEMMCEWVCNI